MTELEKCYGPDGTLVRASYTNINGNSQSIPEAKSYEHAYQRCNNPNHVRYPKYGMAGIEFRFNNFREWWAELGRRPTLGHSVDRIDGRGHYEVGNVRWASRQEQNVNRSSVHAVRLTRTDGSVTDFESATAACLGEDISRTSILNMCQHRAKTVRGYQATFIS